MRDNIYILFVIVIMLLPNSGCRLVSFSDAKTGRAVSIASFGTSIGIESATLKTPEGGEMTLKGYQSDASKALDLAGKVIGAGLSKVP